MRLLLLEDDADVRVPLAAHLRDAGYAVDEAGGAAEAGSLARAYPYDALLVDVRLPEGTDAGFRLVREVRQGGSRVPVLFLTARDAVEDRLEGFRAGGDDYVIKPFHTAEVLARLHALVRRASPAPLRALERGAVRVDWGARRVTVGGAPMHLTAKEYAVLEVLASHPGRVFTPDEIVEHVWDGSNAADASVVKSYVKTLRHKLGEDIVDTVRGHGYRFPEG